jgi:hypothetical protein
MDDSVGVGHFFVDESSKLVVANPWLPEVDHLDIDSVSDQLHTNHDSYCTTETMSCGLDVIGREKFLQPPNFSKRVSVNRI